MKRKLLKYCICLSLILCLCGCKKQDSITNEIEQSKKNYIEKFSGLELPQQGNIILYENNLNEEHYGGNVIVGLELNISEKKQIEEQLKKFEDIDAEEEEKYAEIFNFDKKNIKKAGTRMAGMERFNPKDVPVPLTSNLIAILVQYEGRIYLYLEYKE